MKTVEQVDHPAHYGGADNPYEAIKVIEAGDHRCVAGSGVMMDEKTYFSISDALSKNYRDAAFKSGMRSSEAECWFELATAFDEYAEADMIFRTGVMMARGAFNGAA